MKKLFGLKDESGEEYTLLVQQDLRTGEKHFDFERGRVEPKLEFNPGQWAVTVYGEVFRILSLKDGWVCWINNKGENVRSNPDYLKFATPQEIESHLRKICDEKYVGKQVMCLEDDGIYLVAKLDHYTSWDTLWYKDNKGLSVKVYGQGKWAEIIPDKKKLPKTKDECIQFLVDWMDSHIHDEKDFLKDYED